MPVCLVTGGAGFIGSHLVEALLQRGWHVRVLDDLSSGRWENLESCREEIDFYEASILDGGTLRQAVQGVEAVFHLAAWVSISQVLERPEEALEVNVKGTLRLLEASRRAQVRHFVFASSCAVYGEGGRERLSESLLPRPMNPYGVQKLAGEHYVRVYSQLYSMASLSLRFFNVYGPRQRPDSEYAAVIPRFIWRILGGKPPVVFGDGDQSRDFVYVSDVVDACLKALEVDRNFSGEVCNVGSGRAISVRELAQKLLELADRADLPIEFAPPRLGDLRHSLAELSHSQNILSFCASVSLEEGLEKTLQWFQKHGHPLE